MAISTYSELQTAVQNWLARSDADIASRSVEFIALAEAQFNRDMKSRRMETQTTLTTVGGTETVALPADFIEARALVIQTTPTSTLTVVTPSQLASNWSDGSTGIPIEYSIIGDNIHFGPTPDSAYGAKLTYYQRIPSLTDAAPTNWLLTYHPDAYVYGALLQAAPYLMNDERVPVWGAFYDRAIQGIENETARATWNGGPLVARVGISIDGDGPRWR